MFTPLEITLFAAWLIMVWLCFRLEAIVKHKNANIKFWKTLAEAYEKDMGHD